MDVIFTINKLRQTIKAKKLEGKRIGFMITTGGLHIGHVKLLEILKQHCDYTVVSNLNLSPFHASREHVIMPNPTTEDDCRLMDGVGCDLFFAPPVIEVYPKSPGNQSFLTVPDVSENLCNIGREGYFRGIATACLKMFNIVQPDVTIFGEKDYQQYAVVRKMVNDLAIPVQVLSAPVVRLASGLAYASRNSVLTDDELERAPRMYQAMDAIRLAILRGESDYERLKQEAKDYMVTHGLKPDYVDIRHALNLEPANSNDGTLIVFAAAYLGGDRLVDTLRVVAEPPDIYI